jgi:hypothetical protein
MLPLKDYDMSFIAKVLELPGFPVIMSGILLRMQVIITKMFSMRVELNPTSLSISISSRNLLCS